MNRPLLITIGIVLILLMLGIWGYLLAYGTPQQTSDVFTNLGFFEPADQDARTIDPQGILPEPTVSLALGGSALQQLTTRAVAGFAFASSSEGELVRYVERGTGHVYEINLIAGTEKQISPITIPLSAEAVFSPEANTVVVTAFDTEGSISTILSIENTDADEDVLVKLPRNSANIVFENEQTIYYTLGDLARTIGYRFNLEQETRTELFSVPLGDLSLIWGKGVASIYAFTKPGEEMEGYLYEIRQGSLRPLSDGIGLTTYASAEHIFVSKVTSDIYRTFENGGDVMPVTMIPQKCASLYTTNTKILCAAPLSAVAAKDLNKWYQGAITMEDYLWSINVPAQEALLIGNLPELAMRTIDVSQISINKSDTLLLFTNKIDGTLWLYRIQQE